MRPDQPITYSDVIKLALPASIASMVTPMLGLADAAVLGYSSRPLDVGGVGLAAAIFSLAYWTFGFLRMSTAGLTAQAVGAGDEQRARRILAQSSGFGGLIGLVFVALQVPFGVVAFWLMTNGATVEAETISGAQDYYAMRIWGAPFVFINYACLGWLTARNRTDLLMGVFVFMVGLNILLDAWFVLGFDMGPKGIGLGTLIAEITGCLLAIAAVVHVMAKNGGVRAFWQDIDYFNRTTLKKLAGVNINIFIRTFVLVATFVYFIQRSAVYGDYILSANQLLIQFFLVTGLALDGAAIAAETFVGQSLGLSDGRQRVARFREAAWKPCVVGFGGAVLMVSLYLLFGDALLDLTAPDETINQVARDYFGWVIISPLIVAPSFMLDGIFIGATRVIALRNGMIVSGLVYLGAVFVLTPLWQNHGLWAAFGIFMIARAVTLGVAWPGFDRLMKDGLDG